MCLIAVAKKGSEKYSDFFLEAIRKGSVRNTDGIGFSYKRKGSNSVFIQKGFTTLDEFMEVYISKKLKAEDEVIVHLRIGNKGAKSKEMCHPFVVSMDNDVIALTKGFVHNTIMAHNGTLTDFGNYTSPLSDTFFFVRDFMNVPEILHLLKRNPELFVDTFKFTIKSNRLAFIFPDNTEIILIGDYKEDNGYFFSNESYKYVNYINSGGSESWDWRQYPNGRNFTRRHEIEVESEDVTAEEVTETTTSNRSITNVVRFGEFRGRTIEGDTKEGHMALQAMIASGELKKVGERKRGKDGNLTADSKFDIIPPNLPEEIPFIHNRATGIKLYGVIGRILYTPIRYMKSQFDCTIFNPAIFNYKDFHFFNALGNVDQVSSRIIYKIHQYDDGDPSTTKTLPVHLLNADNYDITSIKGVTNTILFDNSMIIRSFSQVINTEVRNDYYSLYRLVQRFGNPSRNLSHDLSKAIYGAEKKNRESAINFKNVDGLTIRGLKLFYNYVVQSVYPWLQANEMFFETQPKDKAIDFNTALKAMQAVM